MHCASWRGWALPAWQPSPTLSEQGVEGALVHQPVVSHVVSPQVVQQSGGQHSRRNRRHGSARSGEAHRHADCCVRQSGADAVEQIVAFHKPCLVEGAVWQGHCPGAVQFALQVLHATQGWHGSCHGALTLRVTIQECKRTSRGVSGSLDFSFARRRNGTGGVQNREAPQAPGPPRHHTIPRSGRGWIYLRSTTSLLAT